MNDIEFLEAFEGCSLPEAQWTHEAHVRMAWLYLQRRPLSEAVSVVMEGIKRYNASLNKPLAYHETITQAFIYLIRHRSQLGNGCRSFAEFCEDNPDLLDRKLTSLLMHYRKETLFSPSAREAFVTPDLKALPVLE